MSTISGTTINTGITLGSTASPGTYTSPLTITATGAVTASSGDAIYGNISPATIANQGKVEATGVTGDGIDLQLGGSVGNTGTGLIQGYTGVYITGSTGAFGTVINSGTIAGTGGAGFGVYLGQGGSVANNGGLIEGSAGIYIHTVAGTVTNSGTVRGTSGSGVNLLAGGSILNSGSILSPSTVHTVVITGGGYLTNSQGGYIGSGGVYISGGAGTVMNSGTIAGTISNGVDLLQGGSLGNAGLIYGVYIGGSAGTVMNSGTIASTAGIGVDLNLGGSVGNTGLIDGYLVGVGITGAAGTVTNSGTITGTGTFAKGVYLLAGGSIGNNAGLIQGVIGIYIIGAAGTVTNSGTIAGTISNGVDLIAGGSIGNVGQIKGYGGVYIGGGAGTITNSGTIAGTVGIGIHLEQGGTVVDSGTISGAGSAISFGGTGSNLLVLERGYTLVGGVYGAVGATNTLELGGSVGSALTVGYGGLSLTNFGDVLFGSGGYDALSVGGTAGTLPATISGFTLTSDIIDLTAIGTNGSITGQSSTQVTIAGSLGTVTLTFDPSDSTVFTTAGDGATGTELVACFRRGTLISTEHGETAVEDLAIGDRVVTVSGAARPIKWIGRRAYDGRFVAANRAVLPIRIEAGALSQGVPARDLWISPEHALYIDDVLVPAGLLANGITIRQVESIERLEYFHIELAAHDVILAEGAAAESFVDCDNRFMFHNGGEFAALYPGEVPAPWDFCAPRVEPGSPELAAIRAALLRRAGVLGRVTGDPDLHLIADGEIVRAPSVAGRVWRFALPRGARALAIASRSAVPAAADPASSDQRALGVAVERIILGAAGLRLEIGHDCPALCEGFHADEGAHRWTDGMARLPEALLRPLSGNITVELHLTETELCYRLDAPADAAKSTTKNRSIRQAAAPTSPRSRRAAALLVSRTSA